MTFEPCLALVLDTETTGLIENRTINDRHLPSIIEFYGVLVDLEADIVIDEYETLVRPRLGGLSEETTKITGLTDDHVKDAPTWSVVADRVIGMIESAPTVIAHNLSYDREMIDVECQRIGRVVDWPELICTVEQTIHLKGFRLNLSGLHEYLFGVPFPGAHRARADVEALRRCCVELRKRELL